MKTNGEMNHGGKLRRKPDTGTCGREYIVRYLISYRKRNIRVGYVSVQI